MKTSTHRAPALLVSLALSLATALPLAAQITPANDPANLAGERISAPDLADTLPINHGAPALQQLLRKLRTRASFMLIVAHPDDEDNGMLTYLSRGQGARVATLTLNRGEGGQNLMSADFGDALGLIRTQELLAADRYMGVDQFFGTEVDFGFSKTKEEAFAKWGHDRVLYDAVRAIRLYRPLVIASVFIGAPSDGHGQHQVSGQIAQEAFKAAGDPSVFPDQIAAGLLPWQPLKVYARSPFARIDSQGMYDYATSQYVAPRFTNYVTGKVTETVPKANVIVPEGDTDPLLGGESYAQFGREGRNLQRSQIGGGGGPGRGGPGGRADVSYHRYGSRLNQPDGDDSALEPNFFDGIDTTLPAIATLIPNAPSIVTDPLRVIDRNIVEAQKAFDPAHLEACAKPLHDALETLDLLLKALQPVSDLAPEQKLNLLHELRIKRVQLNNALVLALGLEFDATAPTADLTLNSKTVVSSQLSESSTISIEDTFLGLENTTAGSGMGEGPNRVQAGKPTTHTWQVEPSLIQPITRPYFSRPDIEQPYYDVHNPSLRDAPQTPPALVATASVKYQGLTLELRSAVHHGSQPIEFVPPVSVTLDRQATILRPGQKSVGATATITADSAIQQLGGLKVFLAPDPKTKPELLETTFPQEFQKVVGKPEYVGAYVDANKVWGKAPVLTAAVALQNHTYSEGYRPVGYPALVTTNYYTPATLRVVPIDAHTAPKLNIAYLPGTGDDVPSALEDLGIHPHLITTADLTAESLKPYDAVILGVRAYTAHPELAGPHSQALIDYARTGGVVITQFNNGRYGDAEAPFPITVASSSGDHAHDVIDESAPVTILAPDNPLLTWPNKITTADFDNWVEERGHSFAGTWAPQYQPLLETHDPNQQPQQGGLLIAHVGKGSYIYLGLALYRQLPQGVPGAYRLLANLISAAKNPGLQPTPTH